MLIPSRRLASTPLRIVRARHLYHVRKMAAEVVVVGESIVFTLLTWNIDGLDEKDIVERTFAVIETVKRLRPDVLYLQEVVPMTWDMLTNALESRYEFRAANTELPYFHAVLVARKDTIQVSDSLKITKFPHSQMLRHLLHQVVVIAGHAIHLFTSHLESTKNFAGERKRQLTQAFGEMQKLAVNDSVSIFGGDLNIRDSEVDAVGMPQGCVDVWEACGADPGKKYTWDTSTNHNLQVAYKSKCRFDRLYLCQGASPPVKATSFKLIGQDLIESCVRYPSDHWGIMAKFEIQKK